MTKETKSFLGYSCTVSSFEQICCILSDIPKRHIFLHYLCILVVVFFFYKLAMLQLAKPDDLSEIE